MTKTTFISAIALASVLGFVGPSVAQDHMIDGKAVPADQVQAVQEKCDELRAAGSADAAASTDADAAASADAVTDPAADAAGDAAGAATADAAASEEIDLETLTIEMCDEGGFAATAP